MTTFIPNGEEPNVLGVNYIAKLLKRERLVEEINIASLDEIPLDTSYIIGDHSGTYNVLKVIRPKVLISLDAHTDLMHDYFDHASWLAYALEDRLVEKACVIGAVLMIPTTERTKLWTKGVKIFPALPRTRRIKGRWKAYMDLRRYGPERIIEETKRFLKSKEVYLTIDMDILRPEYRVARFQHGELTLKELLTLIDLISREFKILAFDIAEISYRVIKSKYGRRAILEVFSLLKEVVR
ncbi:hypothetical protein PNA2_1435 [Pyrococcus sp. NA2]|uniref:arginase family protein n=1 Tax=Pyrococcus sp. (strain NA2) TaxID=342949 RepID=UPI000209AF2C|nr:arginase family protein [Pyrococcus sp. NA2]AEC52350.1 hypothetical protein PNA2_1435 [Pyrococcus sp. NA2]